MNACFAQLSSSLSICVVWGVGGWRDRKSALGSASHVPLSLPVHSGHLDCSQSDERGARCKRLQRLRVELGGRFRKWDWPRPQTMGGSPLTWLSLYLRAEAHTGHYSMIVLFLRTPRAQPTKGGRGSPFAPYLIYISLNRGKVTHRAFPNPQARE